MIEEIEQRRVMPLRAVPREPSPVAARLIETIRAADEASPLITGFVAWEQEKTTAWSAAPHSSVVADGWMLHFSQELAARSDAE